MALTKGEHIAYWVKSALDSLETAEYLFQGKKYIEALFFTHLHLEKLSKALWVFDNETNYPPKIHNLVRLVEKSSANLTE